MTVWSTKLRGVSAKQNGVAIPGTGRVATIDFRNQTVEYDAGTGELRVGPELTATRAEVNAATTAALAANTRVSNTLTANANGALPAIDGVALTTNDRLLVKNEASTLKNGWYFVADPGSAGSPWQLTRTTDADATAEFVSGATTRILAGTVNANRRYVLTVAGGFVLNTDAVTFTLLSDNGVYDPREFGGVEGGAVDATAFFQDTLDATPPGGTTKPTPGKWLLSHADGITVPEGVTFSGGDIGHQAGPFEFNNALASGGQSGTMLHITHTAVAIYMRQQSTVKNIIGYYPNQYKTDGELSGGGGSPIVYDWFIQAENNAHNTTIQNVTCINPYRFIRIGETTTPYAANGTRIDNVFGYPLSRGIELGRVADVARITNVSFNPGLHYLFGTALKAWVQANGAAFIVDGAEEFFASGCFAYGYNVGWWFRDVDGDGFDGVYGSVHGGGLDIMNDCILIDQPTGLSARGVSFHGLGYVGTTGAGTSYLVHGKTTHNPANADERPRVSIHGRAAWNSFSRIAYLESQCDADITITDMMANATFANEGIRVDSGSLGTITMDRVGMPEGTQRADDGHGSVKDLNGYWTDMPTAMLADDGSRNSDDALTDADATISPATGNWFAMPDGTTTSNRTIDVDNGTAETNERLTVFLGRQGHTIAFRDNANAPLQTIPVNMRCKVVFRKTASNFVVEEIARLP
jgi:hypothetical protein